MALRVKYFNYCSPVGLGQRDIRLERKWKVLLR